ncbi:DUF262 domain-containing protein [Acinetobacter sp. AOR15_HL]|uniref:DUF262 domain-containing protein n=1 Tax=unclassified Acinetobacter TaxID=196816 RepID=UPI0022EB3B8D|nr:MULTISPECIES: DUF262 domain-containing protein [unclassified Acinetobacter]MDA3556643.1 DUF262 domain-containing protein [Acinetobacter sp. AOR15_HL]MDA3573365.1 DUF262 domain-containing protein [Acinetobacter sp. AOR14_HL]
MSLLQEQIDTARMQVHTDSYPMSIGELVNLYDDQELDIHPEFQRVYRWSNDQKSKLIESILLGIPLPSIFVAQRKDGVWDVVDGLQRISTILSFLGKLKDDEGKTLPSLQLQKTKYLPALENKLWDNPDDPDNEIDIEIKRIFKREKIDVKIIKRESDDDTKFELFQRLNTGGTRLTEQEVRNCILLMLNKDVFFWLKDLSINTHFENSISISEKQKEECYSQELALRFFILRNNNDDIRKANNDVAPYLNAEMTRIFNPQNDYDYDFEKTIFLRTFELIDKALDDQAFRKYHHIKNRYEGPLSLPVFEAITYGVSILVENGNLNDDQIIDIIRLKSKELTSTTTFIDTLARRSRPLDRTFTMISLGREVFS